VVSIAPHTVVLRSSAGELALACDQVFVAIGGELPSAFLDKIGVAMHWHHGTPKRVRPHAAVQRP
jgi:hypothetical protein